MRGTTRQRHTFAALGRRNRIPNAVRRAKASALRGWEEPATQSAPGGRYWTADEELADRFHWLMRKTSRVHRQGKRLVNIEGWCIEPSEGGHGPGSLFADEQESYLLGLSGDIGRNGQPPLRSGGHPMVEAVLDSGRTVYLGSFADRVGQYAWMSVVEPLAEQRLSPHLHSYRPARGVQTAILDAREFIRQGNYWAIKVDIEDFFGSIRPFHVEQALRHMTPELSWKLIRLAEAWMWTPIVRRPTNPNRRAGAPWIERPKVGFLRQGNPVAPMLSNIVGAYFIDGPAQTFFSERGQLVRYGDDMLLLAGERGPLVEVLDALADALAHFGFRLSPSKTVGPLDLRGPVLLEFLGMAFSGGRIHLTDRRVQAELERFAAIPRGSVVLHGAMTRVAADLRLVGHRRARAFLDGLAAQNPTRAARLESMLVGPVTVANDDLLPPEAEVVDEGPA